MQFVQVLHALNVIRLPVTIYIQMELVANLVQLQQDTILIRIMALIIAMVSNNCFFFLIMLFLYFIFERKKSDRNKNEKNSFFLFFD